MERYFSRGRLIVLIIFSLFLLACTSTPVYKIDIDGPEKNIQFITGMKGCENICLSSNDSKIYISDLSGFLYVLDKNQQLNEIRMIKKMKLDDYVLGITEGPDGFIYVLTSSIDWLDKGGVVRKIDVSNNSEEIISDYYPGINGLTSDTEGNLYFTTGNLSFFRPDGAIYILRNDNNRSEEVLVDNLKSPNGLCYNRDEHSLLFTEVFSGVKKLFLESRNIDSIFGKTRMVEGFDDLCIDKNGNYWVADPPNGAIKLYIAEKKKVIRIQFEGFGIGSSCKIRIENGEEILYVTEIKRTEKSEDYDGRGVLMMPIKKILETVNITTTSS